MHRLAFIIVPLALSAGAAMAQPAGGGAPGASAVPGAPGSATTGINGSIIGSDTPTTSNGTMPDTSIASNRPGSALPNGMTQNPSNTQPTQTQAPRQLSLDQRKQQQNGVNGSQTTVPEQAATPGSTTATPNGVSAPPAIPPATPPP